MPTSELSDALNPYASQARQRQNFHEYSPSGQHLLYQPVVQLAQPAQQPYAPHVSELELAITGPAAQPLTRSGQESQFFDELVRIISSTRLEERQRRLVWEQEQEAKYAQRQADMESKMTKMFDELKTLRSTVNTLSNPVSSSGLAVVSPTPSQPTMTTNSVHLATPVSPMTHPTAYCQPQPAFVRGTSTMPITINQTYTLPNPPQFFSQGTSTNTPFTSTQTSPLLRPSSKNHLNSRRTSYTQPQPYQEHTFQVSVPPANYTITPDPSQVADTSDRASPRPSRPGKRKKRSPKPSSDEDESSSLSSSTHIPPRKRKNNHDTRCLTIHHAMRLHILRMMGLDNDKVLPDSHPESTVLGLSDPVRFVWDKTTKQSVHNSRMKKRVIDDIKENRKLYKHVSHKDFGKKLLDAAFEQCFVTFRQKFKIQRDRSSALNYKQREDLKAKRARHLSRRKTKLSNRAEARNKITVFEHVTFDGAFHHDCMSSEESDFEVEPQTLESIPIFRTRGSSWRSSRLLRLFDILDGEERNDTSPKIKRGVGKKERRRGPLKEEFVLPPEGVATWMVSKRWYKASLATHPDLPNLLNKLVVDTPGFDWFSFHDLGEDSSDEQGIHAMPQPPPPMPHHPQHSKPDSYNVPVQSMNIGLPQEPYSTNTYLTYAM